MRRVIPTTLAACLALGALPAAAAEIRSVATPATPAAFDVVNTRIKTEGDVVVFQMDVSGNAGADKPAATGKFEDSGVNAYVWPTSLDSAQVGFEPGQGIVALAVTYHPDFDDAAKGARNRDRWHTHWVVLAKDPTCGPAGLMVKDIPAGTKPKLPDTWPGAPILIDSPPYVPTLTAHQIEVRVPLSKLGAIQGASYDGVTAALHVNANLHAPLLCVANVFKIASGDLSLPGKVP